MSVEGLLLKLCVWYKSGSIVESNGMYAQCHQTCSGIMKTCPYYVGKQEYFKAKLEACKKLNEKNNGGEKE